MTTQDEIQSRQSRLAELGRWMFPRRLATGLAVVVVAAAIVNPAPLSTFTGVASCLLIGAGLGLRAWASASAGGHTRDATISAPQLVTAGPYSVVRNPIYLGTVVLGIGMVWLIGDLRLVPLLVGACILLYTTIIPAEEQFLLTKFGPEFEAYRQTVPQLLPRLAGWKSFKSGTRVWANARGDLGIAALLFGIYFFLRVAAWLRN